MKKFQKLLICILFLALSACGGGGGGDSGTSNSGSSSPPAIGQASVLTDAQIISAIKATNSNWEGSNGHLSNGRPAGIWRWPNTPDQRIFVYLPAASNSVEQELVRKVNAAISTYNSKLSVYFVLEAVTVIPASGNVIRVGYNNSWIPPGSTDYNSYCANVSDVAGSGSLINPDSKNNIANPVYVNLGNNRCDVTQEIVNHEFAHALGFNVHFDFFGNTKSPDNFWDVLATLYGNPQSTLAENLVVKHAAK